MFLEKWVSLSGYIFIWMSVLKRRGIFIKRFGVWCKMSRRFDLNIETFVCLNINASLCIFILFFSFGILENIFIWELHGKQPDTQ